MEELTDIQKFQAQAYFNDYQAMISKINWFMSLQFKLFTPLVSFVSLGVAAYNHDYHIAGVWVTTGVVQIIAITYLFALYEVYNHVRYIETELKPKLAGLISLNTGNFWSYEKLLKKGGKAHSTTIGDAIFPVGISLISLLVSLYIRGRSVGFHMFYGWADLIGMFATILLLAKTIHSAKRTVDMRKMFEESILHEDPSPQETTP